MNRLKVAIQKSGRLHVESMRLLKDCGININCGISGINCGISGININLDKRLKISALNFPMDIFLLRDDDIPKIVQNGIADIGIVGKNVVCEQDNDRLIKQNLGFGRCRMSLAVSKDTIYNNVKDLYKKIIVTSYPNLLKRYLRRYKICYYVEILKGSVEITTSIGMGDAIFEIVSSGETLFINNLKEVETAYLSEATLICCPKSEQNPLVKLIYFRIQTLKKKFNFYKKKII